MADGQISEEIAKKRTKIFIIMGFIEVIAAFSIIFIQ